MVGEIAAALTSLKAAGELAKGMVDIRDAALFQSKAIELQTQILSAQESALRANERQTALIEKIKALEEEVTALKKRNADKGKYKLKNLGDGSFAYVYEPQDGSAEPVHWLCVKCFDDGKRGIMQYNGRTQSKRESIYTCPNCKNSLQVDWGTAPGE